MVRGGFVVTEVSHQTRPRTLDTGHWPPHLVTRPVLPSPPPPPGTSHWTSHWTSPTVLSLNLTRRGQIEGGVKLTNAWERQIYSSFSLDPGMEISNYFSHYIKNRCGVFCQEFPNLYGDKS